MDELFRGFRLSSREMFGFLYKNSPIQKLFEERKKEFKLYLFLKINAVKCYECINYILYYFITVIIRHLYTAIYPKHLVYTFLGICVNLVTSAEFYKLKKKIIFLKFYLNVAS